MRDTRLESIGGRILFSRRMRDGRCMRSKEELYRTKWPPLYILIFLAQWESSAGKLYRGRGHQMLFWRLEGDARQAKNRQIHGIDY